MGPDQLAGHRWGALGELEDEAAAAGGEAPGPKQEPPGCVPTYLSSPYTSSTGERHNLGILVSGLSRWDGSTEATYDAGAAGSVRIQPPLSIQAYVRPPSYSGEPLSSYPPLPLPPPSSPLPAIVAAAPSGREPWRRGGTFPCWQAYTVHTAVASSSTGFPGPRWRHGCTSSPRRPDHITARASNRGQAWPDQTNGQPTSPAACKLRSTSPTDLYPTAPPPSYPPARRIPPLLPGPRTTKICLLLLRHPIICASDPFLLDRWSRLPIPSRNSQPVPHILTASRLGAATLSFHPKIDPAQFLPTSLIDTFGFLLLPAHAAKVPTAVQQTKPVAHLRVLVGATVTASKLLLAFPRLRRRRPPLHCPRNLSSRRRRLPATIPPTCRAKRGCTSLPCS